MTKKDFQQLANFCVGIVNDVAPVELINQMCQFCYENNPRFDSARFKEWIQRKVDGESTVGLG